MEYTESHMAELFAGESLASTFAWSAGLGWMQWTGKRWERAPVASPREAARQWVMGRYAATAKRLGEALAAKAPHQDIKVLEEELAAFRSYSSRYRINSLVELAQGIAGVLRRDAEFDADQDLLNCGNGILNLRTGELVPHDPARLLTKLAPADYVPDAAHEDWD